MEKGRIEVSLNCPICVSRNIIPVGPEKSENTFECRECGAQWTIIKPKILGYEVVVEKKKEVKKRRRLENILDGVLLGWLLSR
ncbi:MAG: hypothetical protein QXD32_07220 [Nitrososphaerota archaeon]